MERLVPRANTQGRIALLGACKRLRRTQLAHACDRPPDASLARLGLVDDIDAPDTFAPQAVGNAQAGLAPADDYHIVIGAGPRPHPIGRVRSRPTQGALCLSRELGGGALHLRLRTERATRIRRREQRGSADSEASRVAEETAPIDSALRAAQVLAGLRGAFEFLSHQ